MDALGNALYEKACELDLVCNAIGARGVEAVNESVHLAGVSVRL